MAGGTPPVAEVGRVVPRSIVSIDMTAPSIPNVNVSNPEAQNVSVSSDSAEELDNVTSSTA